MEVKKKPRGRPKVFTKEELRRRKTLCTLNKKWYCEICQTGINYTLAGKWCHMKTKKHARNIESLNEQ